MFIPGVIVSLLIGYLLGSINPSILFSRAKGQDIRTMGSGNAGLTNTLRSYGKTAALFVLICDIAKAAVAICVTILFVKLIGQKDSVRLFEILAAAGVILGHNYPVYFGFKGGKGILVSITAIMILNWQVGVAILAIFIVVFAVSHYVSLGSVVAAFFTPIISAVIADDIYFTVFTAFASVLAIWRHRSNIVRLVHGTEKKTTFSKKN